MSVVVRPDGHLSRAQSLGTQSNIINSNKRVPCSKSSWPFWMRQVKNNYVLELFRKSNEFLAGNEVKDHSFLSKRKVFIFTSASVYLFGRHELLSPWKTKLSYWITFLQFGNCFSAQTIQKKNEIHSNLLSKFFNLSPDEKEVPWHMPANVLTSIFTRI